MHDFPVLSMCVFPQADHSRVYTQSLGLTVPVLTAVYPGKKCSRVIRENLAHLYISVPYIRMYCRCDCLMARLSGLHCYNMGHNGHGINLCGVIMTIMGN